MNIDIYTMSDRAGRLMELVERLPDSFINKHLRLVYSIHEPRVIRKRPFIYLLREERKSRRSKNRKS